MLFSIVIDKDALVTIITTSIFVGHGRIEDVRASSSLDVFFFHGRYFQ
ncbi:hypothetical protein BIW11_04360 [Tropilaelaps mercedesae]|uniref:Uncharacterized protein n=1 Tax=Tropilaelaps mercedesae TaxID=418985 RepID=A0A1V9X7X4_9ACAR|nr:hypothetical protein BIW11_04360 [Tropilaelaps mercedesae]